MPDTACVLLLYRLLQAVTRAKERLYLTCPRYRSKPSQDTQQYNMQDKNRLVRSEFLHNIAPLMGKQLSDDLPVLVEEDLMTLG
jgi:hypothetical protein